MKFRFLFLFLSLAIWSPGIRAQHLGGELKSSQILIDSGIAFYDEEDYDKALQCYRQVYEGDSNYLDARYETGITYLSLKQYDSAVNCFNYCIDNHYPDVRRCLLQIGNAYDLSGKPDSALNVYDTLIKLYPVDNHPYFEKAVLYAGQGNPEKGVACLGQSLLMNPSHAGFYMSLGRMYLLQGRLS